MPCLVQAAAPAEHQCNKTTWLWRWLHAAPALGTHPQRPQLLAAIENGTDVGSQLQSSTSCVPQRCQLLEGAVHLRGEGIWGGGKQGAASPPTPSTVHTHLGHDAVGGRTGRCVQDLAHKQGFDATPEEL